MRFSSSPMNTVPSSSFTIRDATRDDAEIVATIYIESRRRHVGFARLVHSEEEIREWVRCELIRKKRVLVVEESRSVVATMALSSASDGNWIDHLYVAADLTGRGVGSALVEVAKQKLPPPILLYTFQQNHGARRFYERHGFKAWKLSDGSDNEERCPDVLYRWDGDQK